MMDEKVNCQVQAALGRDLLGREVEGLDQIVSQHGTPEIEPLPGAVRLTWVVDGQQMSLLIPATATPEKPRNMVREHLERLGRQRGVGTLVTETQRIGLDGRRTIERRVDHFRRSPHRLWIVVGAQRLAREVLAGRRRRPPARASGRVTLGTMA